MTPTSLFARELRAWRTRNGRFGRLTQESLADLLGVSAEAVSKYERSLSFIRGDLEPRLVERLGWSRDTVLACREDWEGRAASEGAGGRAYRLLDDQSVSEVFGSWHEAAVASLRFAEAAFPDLPEGFAPCHPTWTDFYETFTGNWDAVLSGDEMVAKWSLPFLLPEDEQAFREGRLLETDMTADRVRRAVLPGTYFGYCPALIVAPGHEAASAPLLASFIRFLEDHARRDILLHGIGTISVSAGGAQICRDLGMTKLGTHVTDGSYGIWELPGSAIPASIFGRKSPLLARAYSAMT
ncbi:hypothetical protein GQ651_15925 [Alphaproteobacteria bacterium GH1-50]|uniref:HTH cro/C1-type domain-containing protein n=1 Tax=Kangsaoukella pontilimi TaxID=2691042 RepID=A0A7C9MYP7_9RHOB|nr:helix-turn-helix transcriptional regulator [Kangsaoukella pontilimi]MXQ09334.1 hypothetical protein [Kangsaoukella pontilimi]